MSSLEETRAEIERTRSELDDTLNRFEAKVHHELDWKARLRRSRSHLIIAGVGLATVVGVGVAGAMVIRSRRHRSVEDRLRHITNFAALKDEVVRLRGDLLGGARAKDEPMWSKVALKASAAMGAAAASMITKTLVEKFDAGEGDDVHPDEVAAKAAGSV